MVGIENVASFWEFDNARKAFMTKAHKLGYEVRKSTLTSGHFGSVQALRKRVYIMLVKPEYEAERTRWTQPARPKHSTRTVHDIMSATPEQCSLLQSKVATVKVMPRSEEWYKGPVPVAMLSTAPHKDPFHKSNRGFRVYSSKGTAATVTTTTELAPGGATQLYQDVRGGQRIVRQLSVRETWEVMGRPFPVDLSENRRDTKLKLLGQSEDGFLVRAWAKSVFEYSAQHKHTVKYMHEDGLQWSREQAHARCLHLSDWCAGLLGLKPLK